MTPAQGVLRVLRGVVLASTAASLSVASHGAAGGSLPDKGTTAVVTTLLAGVGVALADRRRGSCGIVGALATSQVALHLFLQVTGTHRHSSAPLFDPAAMFVAHALAALLTGLLMARAEQALFVVAKVLERTLPRKPRPLPVVIPAHTICIPAVTVRMESQLIARRIHALRGPPEIRF